MGMATEHEARLHGIENLPDGWDAIIRFTAVPARLDTHARGKYDATECQTFSTSNAK
jgi:hypothetical protein